MTTTAKAASNGSKTATTATAEPERKSGMAYVRDAEAYHLASLAHDAAYEAERLCSTLYRETSDAYTRTIKDDGEPEPDSWVQADQRTRLIEEAVRCLDTAQHYLRSLVSEPPF
jgi:hypothetical protein